MKYIKLKVYVPQQFKVEFETLVKEERLCIKENENILLSHSYKPMKVSKVTVKGCFYTLTLVRNTNEVWWQHILDGWTSSNYANTLVFNDFDHISHIRLIDVQENSIIK